MKTKPAWIYWRVVNGRRSPWSFTFRRDAIEYQRLDARPGVRLGPIMRVDVPLPGEKP